MVSLGQLSLILLSGDVAVNPGPLSFGFANCHSIKNKGLLSADEVNSGRYDFFGLTETHIKAHDTTFFLQVLTPDGFSLVHTSRSNKSGGGVGFFIKKTFESKNIACAPNFSSFEHHTISLSFQVPQFKSFLKISCLILVFCRPYLHLLLFVGTLIFM